MSKRPEERDAFGYTESQYEAADKRLDMEKDDRMERDRARVRVFSYLGHGDNVQHDIVCARCLAKPETAALYSGDESRQADLRRDGETSIWHRSGDGEALTAYTLSCSLCGMMISTERTDSAYFAADVPFRVQWLDGNFQPVGAPVTLRAVTAASAISVAADRDTPWTSNRARARISRGGKSLGVWAIVRRGAGREVSMVEGRS